MVDFFKWEDRNIRLLGYERYKKVINSHVVIIGLGGVGSWAAEAIGRSGIRHLTIIDEDYICSTNINRQIHALHSEIGKSKVIVMKKRLEEINPNIQIRALQMFYSKEKAKDIFDLKPDIIIDTIDNVTTKLHLLASCIYLGQPIISCLGASARIDPTKIKISELRKTRKDPLAKTIRKNLWRKYKINLQRVRDLYAIYSDEDLIEPLESNLMLNCSIKECKNYENQGHTCFKRRKIYGNFVSVTGVMGLMAAAVVIQYLAGMTDMSLKPRIIKHVNDEEIINPIS